MEELEKRKMMLAISAPHIRALVDRANELKIQREDIVSILDRGDEVVLIFYS